MLASEAAAQGVPVADGSALGQVVARLSALSSDLGVQGERGAARAGMAAVEAEQLAVLDRITAALGSGPGGGAYAPPADLEGDGPLGAAAVYPPGPGGPMDERLLSEGRESVEAMIVQVSAEYAPRAASVGFTPTQFARSSRRSSSRSRPSTSTRAPTSAPRAWRS